MRTRIVTMGDVTEILQGWKTDKSAAIERLMPLVYAELHKIAASYMRGAKPDHTLQATALINEAYLRMVKQEGASYEDRSHFFALAAKMMRGILVDFARARASEKRGSGGKVQFDDNMDLSDGGASEFLVVHEALEKLKDVEPRKAAVIELRYFGGLTFEEIAVAQDISLITAKRDSAYAEAWLRRAMGGKEQGGRMA
jgi:RNA polymerase sigma-70 factor (ECF subfamily)